MESKRLVVIKTIINTFKNANNTGILKKGNVLVKFINYKVKKT